MEISENVLHLIEIIDLGRNSMTTYVLRNGQLVEKSLAGPKWNTSDAPNVISDTMDATRHMCDGNYYTSKAKFREITKQHGCVEVGNDTSHTRPRQPIPLDRSKRREDIRRAIYELRNGR